MDRTLKIMLIKCLNRENEDSSDSISSSSISSSSSDDEEIVKKILLHKKRRISVSNINQSPIKLITLYSNEDFLEQFRVKKEVFQELLIFVENMHDNHQKISAEKKLMLFLWFAGQEACSYRSLSDRFNVSLSTVHSVISRLSKCFSGLADKHIVWPNEVKRKECEHFFLEFKRFPGVIGCIDGTKICIDPVDGDKEKYIDENGHVSLSLQLVCNHEKKFTDIFVGYPGSVKDADMYSSSELFSSLQNKIDEGQYLLGDSAYRCSKYFLTPYRDDGHLTSAQKHFNKLHSSCRIFIEYAIAILKRRFKQLYYCKLRGIDLLCHFIKACVFLHNMCSIEDFLFVERPPTEEEDDDAVNELSPTESNTSSGEERDKVCKKLWLLANSR